MSRTPTAAQVNGRGTVTACDITEVADADETLSTAVFAFAAGADEAGQRLDAAAARVAEGRGLALSRTRLKALIEDGCLTIDGAVARDGKRKLKTGEAVSLRVPEASDPEPKGEALPLAVVHEDAHLIVIDKPAGLVVHPAPGHGSGTLVNALIARCGASLSGIGGVRRPGIVHRLDKDTSGLLVVAKTDAAHAGLARLFADHGRTLPLQRSYLAFVWGEPSRQAGAVEAPLGRHGTDRLRMAVTDQERGRAAITHWRLEERYGGGEGGHVAEGQVGEGQAEASLLACQLETGRTHQIRVHMAHLGHPVLGDPLYARGFRTKASRLPEAAREKLDSLGRQALHAARLGFAHPITGEILDFESALPADLEALRMALRRA